MKFFKKLFKRDPDKASQKKEAKANKLSAKKAAKAIKILGDDEIACGAMYHHLEKRAWNLDAPSFVGAATAVAASAMILDDISDDDLGVFDLHEEPPAEWFDGSLDGRVDLSAPSLVDESQTLGDLIEQQVQGSIHDGRR